MSTPLPAHGGGANRRVPLRYLLAESHFYHRLFQMAETLYLRVSNPCHGVTSILRSPRGQSGFAPTVQYHLVAHFLSMGHDG